MYKTLFGISVCKIQKKGGNIMEEIWKDIKGYERIIPSIKSWQSQIIRKS